MKKQVALSLCIIYLIMLNIIPIIASDANDPNYEYALKLKEIGVFIGSDTGFDLGRAVTRIEGLVMLIRLLGKEDSADAMKNQTCVFTDVPGWAVGYANYAKSKNLTKGISATLFGSDDTMSATQYLTFLLRALGYDDSNGDFVWSESLEKSIDIGLVNASNNYSTGTFLRSSVAKLSYDALRTKLKNSTTSLAQYLVNIKAIDEKTAVAIEIINNPAVINGRTYALMDSLFYELGESNCSVDVVSSATINNSKASNVYVQSSQSGSDASSSLLVLPVASYDYLVFRVISDPTTQGVDQVYILDGKFTSLSEAKNVSSIKTGSISETSSLITIDCSTLHTSYITLYLKGTSKGSLFIYGLYLY